MLSESTSDSSANMDGDTISVFTVNTPRTRLTSLLGTVIFGVIVGCSIFNRITVSTGSSSNTSTSNVISLLIVVSGTVAIGAVCFAISDVMDALSTKMIIFP